MVQQVPPQKKLSVIVPVHNLEDYIAKSVDSLLAQTMVDNMEIILVENGSSDHTLAVCEEIAKNHPIIKVLVSEEIGPSAARNYGVQHASGEWIAFIDGDDYVDKEMFETLVRESEMNCADSAYCNYMFENEGSKKKYPLTNTGQTTVRNAPEVVYDIIQENSTSSPCVRIFKREFFETHKFPVGKFYEDHATIYRWVSEMTKLVYVSKPFYHYCLREGSTTMATNDDLRKLVDYIEADLERIPFARDYNGFTYEQRRKTLRHIIRMCTLHLKRYIAVMPVYNKYDTTLLSLRNKLLDATASLPHDFVGSKSKRRLFEMKHLWFYHYWRRRKRRARYLKK